MSVGRLARGDDRRAPLDLVAVGGWAIGLVMVGVGSTAVVLLRPSWLIVVGLLATVAALVLVAAFPGAVVPVAWVLVVFIGVARKIVAGPSGHIENDPLIAAPYVLLLPLLVARIWWGSRYRAHLWFAVGLAAIVTGSFLLVAVQGTATFVTVRSAVEQVAAPLVAVALVHPALRASRRAALVAIRWSALVAGAYGIVQFVAPPRWDMRWLENVVYQQGVQTFGLPVPGQFRLFGPMNSPLAFSIVLSVGIACWMFSTGRLWVRLPAIAVMAVPLVLTLVRTSVFALVLTLPIAALLHYRRRAVAPLIGMAAVLAAIPAVLGVVAPDLVQRFSVAALGTDTSYNARVQLLDSGSSSLIGLGGGPGASSRGSIVTDNGYLAAFIDFGTLGGVVFVLLVALALVAAVRHALQSQSSTRGLPFALVLIYALAETSAPVIQGQEGLVFWITLAVLGGDTLARDHQTGSAHLGGEVTTSQRPATSPA